MKKKFLATVLASAMTLAMLTGCGSTEAETTSETTDDAAVEETAEESEPAEDAATEETADTADEEVTGKLAEIQERGKLILVTDAAWAPFEYIDATEEPVGSDVDLARDIADALGVELEIINASFDSIATYLTNGEADIAIAAITITDERKEAMDFSNPYCISQQYIIVPEDNATVTSIEDLAGMKVGVHLGTTGDFLVSDEIALDDGVLNGTGAVATQYKNLAEGCIAMKNGDIDAIVCDYLLAENLCTVNEGLKCFEALYADGSSTKEEYGIAVAKGDDAFVAKINEIINPLVEDGTVQSYIDKHTELASLLNEDEDAE